MSNNMFKFLTGSVLALLSTAVIAETPAVTIKLSQVAGNVMLNDGTKFTKAVSGTVVKPGTKIIASNNAAVDLIYQNGCVKQVKANTMLTVGTQAECVAKISDERTYVAAAGNPSGLGGKTSILSNPLVVTGLVVTAIAVPVAIANSGDSNNDPVSP